MRIYSSLSAIESSQVAAAMVLATAAAARRKVPIASRCCGDGLSYCTLASRLPRNDPPLGKMFQCALTTCSLARCRLLCRCSTVASYGLSGPLKGLQGSAAGGVRHIPWTSTTR